MKSTDNTEQLTPPALASANGSGAGLNHEMRFDEESQQWQVWTPFYDGALGAILGTGKTELEAKADAVKNMELLCEEFYGMRSNVPN